MDSGAPLCCRRVVLCCLNQVHLSYYSKRFQFSFNREETMKLVLYLFLSHMLFLYILEARRVINLVRSAGFCENSLF